MNASNEKTLRSLSLDPEKQELTLASILVDDMVKDQPERFRTEDNKRKLRGPLLEDIDH